MEKLWSPVIKTTKDGDVSWGLGWAVMDEISDHAFCQKRRFYTCHTGGAVGASSVLLIFPRKSTDNSKNSPPSGIVVAIICNMQNVGLTKLALDVAKNFEGIQKTSAQRVRKIYECWKNLVVLRSMKWKRWRRDIMQGHLSNAHVMKLQNANGCSVTMHYNLRFLYLTSFLS